MRFLHCPSDHGLHPTMAYLIHSHISYILEANSKRPIREKKKTNRKQSKAVLKKLNRLTFFSFLTKIFHNILFSSLCFQNNYDKNHCLHSMPKVNNKTKF